MSAQLSGEQKKWSQGLDEPKLRWRMLGMHHAGSRGANMLGDLVEALTDLTDRWLQYDQDRAHRSERVPRGR